MSSQKASDILLEILEKLSNIEAFCKNMDNNYKIIIARLDKLKIDKREDLTHANPVITLNIPETQPAPAIKASQKKPKTIQNDVDFPEAKVNNKTTNVTITQTVLYPTEVGKNNNVVLAQVKLFNDQKQEISKTITDAAGRWKLEVSPGNYFIHVTKPSSNKKPKVDYYFPILIDGSSSVLELETLHVKNE